MPVMPVLANGGTYIKPFLETSAKYFFGELPCTERLGTKTDEDIQNEFAKHHAHVRQVNNVDDTSTK